MGLCLALSHTMSKVNAGQSVAGFLLPSCDACTCDACTDHGGVSLVSLRVFVCVPRRCFHTSGRRVEGNGGGRRKKAKVGFPSDCTRVGVPRKIFPE